MQRFVVSVFGPAIILGLFYASSRMGHARFMNVFRRVVAIWFVSLGSLAVITSIVWIGWPGLFPDEPPAPVWGKVVYAALFGAVAAFGVLLMCAPTYRPDLGDTMRLMGTEPWREELARRQGRRWWTGDPVHNRAFDDLNSGSAI
jgi:hypothetical protein